LNTTVRENVLNTIDNVKDILEEKKERISARLSEKILKISEFEHVINSVENRTIAEIADESGATDYTTQVDYTTTPEEEAFPGFEGQALQAFPEDTTTETAPTGDLSNNFAVL
jgi:hypothetical protein